MGAVIVQDQVQLQIRWRVGLQGLRELAKFLGAMPAMTLADYRAHLHIQGDQQGCGSIANIVMGAAFQLGSKGWLRGRAWICDFSSTYNTCARQLEGGLQGKGAPDAAEMALWSGQSLSRGTASSSRDIILGD